MHSPLEVWRIRGHRGSARIKSELMFRADYSNQFKYSFYTNSYVLHSSFTPKLVQAINLSPPSQPYPRPTHRHKCQRQQAQQQTMVSTKLLSTLSPSTILPKPRLRRSIPFGSYANAYGYEKLSNEDESKSLIGSINSYNSCSSSSSSSGGTLHDGPADDESTAVCSVSSVVFSVGDQSMSSDECSYSYSLCSTSFLARGPSSRTPFKQYGED
eukprot:scaffold45505_cov146-Skeletonema_marinoi.AAC.1